MPAVEEDDNAGSDVSEWEFQEHREQEEGRRAEELGAAGELGAGGEIPLLLPMPPLMASADEE